MQKCINTLIKKYKNKYSEKTFYYANLKSVSYLNELIH